MQLRLMAMFLILQVTNQSINNIIYKLRYLPDFGARGKVKGAIKHAVAVWHAVRALLSNLLIAMVPWIAVVHLPKGAGELDKCQGFCLNLAPTCGWWMVLISPHWFLCAFLLPCVCSIFFTSLTFLSPSLPLSHPCYFSHLATSVI